MYIGIDFGTTHSSMTVFQYGWRQAQAVSVTPNDEPYDTIMRTAAFVPPGVNAESVAPEALLVHDLGKVYSRKDFAQGVLLRNFKPYLNRFSLKNRVMVPHTATIYDPHREMPRDRVEHRAAIVNGPYSRAELVAGAAAVMRRLIEGLRKMGYAPEEAEGILIGNPVGFLGYARRRLLHACCQAGLVKSAEEALRRIRFVHEPVAVACHQVTAGMKTQRVLVFDFGGGTLDLAIVRFEPTKGLLHPVEIEAMDGLAVAGHHIDWLILKQLRAKYPELEQNVRSGQDNLSNRWQLLQQVEDAKKELSIHTQAILHWQRSTFEVTRAELESWMGTVLQGIRGVLNRLLEKAKLTPASIDRVVTAGGSALMPAVQNLLREMFDPSGRKLTLYDATDARKGGSVEKALTAVSSGLSAFGLRSELRERTERSFYVLSRADELVEVLAPGVAYESGPKQIAQGQTVQPSLPGKTSMTLTVYERALGNLELLVEYADIPVKNVTPEVRCSHERGQAFPTFTVGDGVFGVAGVGQDSLSRFLSSDESALSFGATPPSPRRPAHRIGRGDRIRAKVSDRGPQEGEVIEIRRREDSSVLCESSPQLVEYTLRLQNGSARTDRFVARSQDVVIEHKSESFKDTLDDNLFLDQLRC